MLENMFLLEILLKICKQYVINLTFCLSLWLFFAESTYKSHI